MPSIDEFQRQRAFVLWYMGKQYPKQHPLAGQWKIIPAKLPGVVAWHTPNGGKRDGWEASRFKDLGVLPGVHDWLMLWGGLYGIEFKNKGGTTSDAQDVTHAAMLAAGLAGHLTTDSVRDAVAQVIAWGLVRADATVPPFAC